MIKMKLAVVILLMTFSQNLFSQTKTITGAVTDEEGVPLPGATVLVEGTSNGTTADFDGNYVLEGVAPDDQLTFSYIGYVAQRVAINGRASINVSMAEDTQALDEVVVVGYGTQSRAEVTGAITTVDSEEITATPIATADQALQGRAAGVTVLNTGSPGTAPVVRIRGLGTMNNNEPLYVIDGVIAGGLGSVNPSDIASINVLKDASTTAIYGSLGSNGVVMVTTKKGKKNQKTTINLDTYTGFQFNDKRYDVLNTQQYLQYAQEAWDITPSSPFSSSGIDTDWQDALYRSGIMQNIDLGIAGGGENSNFRFSANYTDQEGAIIETEFERFSFRANSDFTLGKFSFGETFAVSFNKQNPEGSLGGGRSLLEHAIKIPPYLPIYNPNNLGGFQGPSSGLDGQDAENPIRVQTLGYRENLYTNVLGSLFGEFEIAKNLKFKSQVGLDYTKSNFNQFIPSYNDDSEGATHTQAFADITKNTGTSKNITITNSLNYSTTFKELHNLEVLLLAEKQNLDFENINANSHNFVSDDLDQLSNTDANLTSDSGEYNRISYLGRLNYNYDQRYIFAASIRRDGSSRFGPGNKWGNFPSLALGWNIAREAFLESSAFNTFKLRGSWGITGNDKIGNYAFATNLTSNFFYPIAGNAAVGVTPAGLGNPDLKWEETAMLNVGLDLGLWDNKFTAAIEYYRNNSDDLLLNRTLPLDLGINSGVITENVGSVETTGVEVTLGYSDYKGDFTWSANLNVGTSSNEVKSLGAQEFLEGGNFEAENLSRVSVGEPLFYFYGLETDGIYQTQAEVDAVFTADPTQTTTQPGDIRFVDYSGDGNITADDKVKIGNPYPDFTYGVNLSADYKGWDLGMFINGVQGVDLYNTNIYDLEGMPRLFNSGTAVLNRWNGPGTSNTVPKAGNLNNVLASDRFIEDGSFARLKNITLGHTVKTDIIGDYISKLRIYASAQNLVTITDYSGLDPEVGNPLTNDGGDRQYELGIDRGNYPQPKSVLLGLQVSF